MDTMPHGKMTHPSIGTPISRFGSKSKYVPRDRKAKFNAPSHSIYTKRKSESQEHSKTERCPVTSSLFRTWVSQVICCRWKRLLLEKAAENFTAEAAKEFSAVALEDGVWHWWVYPKWM